MFRAKRSDTTVKSIEETYRIDLNARADMLLGNLLVERGFDSLSQLLKAYRGNLTYHPRKRRIFLSFHAEDLRQVQGFRLMAMSKNVAIDFHDASVKVEINSENGTYLRQVIRERISRAQVLLCLIGNGTAWRDWVDWEISTARALRKGICGARLKGSRGHTPPGLTDSSIAKWNITEIVANIERAAARRS